MLKFNFFRGSLLLCLAAFLGICIQGCRKTDTSASEQIPNADALSIQKMKDRLQEERFTTTVLVNKPVTAFVADENGEPIVKSINGKNSKLIRTGTVASASTLDECGYSNENYDANIFASLISVTSYYQCGSGYQLTVKWRISVPIANVTDFSQTRIHPTPNSSIKSKGKYNLYNAGSTLFSSNSNITPIINIKFIQNETNPSSPYNKIYEMEYISPFIDPTTYGQIWKIENSMQVFTNCADLPSVNIPFQPNTTLTISTTNPYARVDKIWINPQYPGMTGSLAGVNTIPCANPPGYSLPTHQQIRIRPSTSPTWLYNIDAPPPTSDPTYPDFLKWNKILQNFDYLSLPILPGGSYKFQYRNSSNNLFSANDKGPWGTEETYSFATY